MNETKSDQPPVVGLAPSWNNRLVEKNPGYGTSQNGSLFTVLLKI